MRTLGGRYQLEQRIGIGGMSEVWRGHDRVLDRAVAVKVLAPTLATDTAAYERAQAEARAAAQLAHPNVAGVYDFGVSPFLRGQPAPYIVMELVEGATLAEHLESGPIEWRIAARICAEISAALTAAHAHGIVHRDIKPANIMLTPSGAKVLDFGIASGSGQPDALPAGVVLGTPAYVAPERLDGQPAAPATDMYAVGVVLYHCLTGRLPWPADTGPGLLHRLRHEEPAELPAIAGLAPEVADLCRRCLHREPGERPTSLVAALVLAEAVDARVYVPSIELPPVKFPAAPSASADPAAATAVNLAAGPPPEPVDPPGGAAGEPPPAGSAGGPDRELDRRGPAAAVGVDPLHPDPFTRVMAVDQAGQRGA
ncbi:MAG TPA: serine/threonine-protein kinase [Micromonosporaceae bacterium]|nr:serine/threonine-protein kinase [Micromonosporaceae bacterium]